MPLAGIAASLISVLQLVLAGASAETVGLAVLSSLSALVSPDDEAKVLGAAWHEIEKIGGSILEWAMTRPFEGPSPADSQYHGIGSESYQLRQDALALLRMQKEG